MWNILRILAEYVGHLSAYFFPWRTIENRKETAHTNTKTENYESKQLLDEKEKELETLKIDYNDIRKRNDELQGLLCEKENGLETLRMDYNDLRTRLSEMGAMQLTEGNPNITDLSDQNRPDKIAEQFSELYDNQWTDCYEVLMDRLTKSEQETVETLLTILKTVYDISLNRSQEIMSDARKVLVAFAGMSDGESEKGLDSLIQETLHKMKSYRTKHFKAVPKDIAKEINEKLEETIGEQGVTVCSEYIEACVRICWLMCIKDPPMYIFCEKEDVFNKNHFMEYTEKGHKVSYVVWPVLYLYKNGPLIRKGVAQGEGKEIEDGKVAATEDGSPKSNELVEKSSQFSTGISEMVQFNEDDDAESEFSENNEHYLERMQIKASLNTSDGISVQEHVSDQQVGTKDINASIAENYSSTGPSNEGKYMHLIGAVDSDALHIQFQDVERSQTEMDTYVDSSLQGVIEGSGKENSMKGNAAHVTADEQSEQSEYTANAIKSLNMHNHGGEATTQQNKKTRNQAELYHSLGKDKENDRSSEDKDAEDNIAVKDQADEQVISPNTDDKEAEDIIAVKDQADKQVKSPNTDVTNTISVNNIEDQGSRTSSTEEGAERQVYESGKQVSNNSSNNHGYDNTLEVGTERQVDESGKQNDVVINVQLLALTGHNPGAPQHRHDKHCFIEEHGQNVIEEKQKGETELTDANEIQTVEDDENLDGDRHVENVLMEEHTPVNVSTSEEHEHELSNPCGENSNTSSNNRVDHNTLEVRHKHIVQTSIGTSEKTQEDNSGKVADAGMSIQDNEMELGKKTNDIVLLEDETHTVDNASDMDAPHSLHERCEETEEGTELKVKEDNLRVGNVCNLSENNVPSENDADDNNLNVADATTDVVANPTVKLQLENHHQGILSEDSGVEGN